MAGRLYTLLAIFTLWVMQDVRCLDSYENGKFYRSNSSLTEVPTDIPSDAIEIHLNDNEITKIRADDFRNATYCVTLNLMRNLISEIEPGSFKDLSILAYLGLRSNQLEELRPNIFGELLVLDTLNIGYIYMRLIPSGLFTGVRNIRFLDIDGNFFPDLKSNSFRDLDSLRILDLNNCNIRTIQPNAFYGLNQLDLLKLVSNKLTELGPGVFNGLNRLTTLFLIENKLSSLDVDVFRELPRPIHISVTLNAASTRYLECDDKLCWTKKEEEAGTIIWFWGRHPQCKNDIDWDNWNCTEPDSSEQTSRFSKVSEEITTTSSTTENDVEDDRNSVLVTSLGVVGGICVGVVATVVIVVFCLKRRGVNVCQRSKAITDNGYVNPVKPSVQEESAASVPREPPPPHPIFSRPMEPPPTRPVSNHSYATVYDHVNNNNNAKTYMDID